MEQREQTSSREEWRRSSREAGAGKGGERRSIVINII